MDEEPKIARKGKGWIANLPTEGRELTFAEAFKLMLEVKTLREATVKSYQAIYKHHLRGYHGKMCSRFNAKDCIAIYEKALDSGLATANRTMRTLSCVLRFSAVLTEIPTIEPLQIIRKLGRWQALPGRKGRIQNHEMPAFFAALQNEKQITRALMTILLFTGLRKGEAALATWSEIDWATRVWNVPAIRMKGKVAHDLALSDYPLSILAALYRSQGCPAGDRPVFPSSAESRLNLRLWHRNFLRVKLASGCACNAHDIRRTYASIGAELGMGEAVLRRLLSHTSGSVTYSYLHLDTTFARNCNEKICSRIVELAQAGSDAEEVAAYITDTTTQAKGA